MLRFYKIRVLGEDRNSRVKLPVETSFKNKNAIPKNYRICHKN